MPKQLFKLHLKLSRNVLHQRRDFTHRLTHKFRAVRGRSMVPADEVDEGFVFQGGVRSAGASSFVRQLHNVILVDEFPAHLTAADHLVSSLDTHSCNKRARENTVSKKCTVHLFRVLYKEQLLFSNIQSFCKCNASCLNTLNYLTGFSDFY